MTKKLLQRLIGLTLCYAILSGAASAAYVTDVPADNWANTAVQYVVDAQIMPTDNDGSFYPDVFTTRGEFVLYLWRMAGANIEESYEAPSFTDVPEYSDYWYPAEWASLYGVSNGMGDGTFAPDQSLTRQEAFTFLYRALTSMGIKFPPIDLNEMLITEFDDFDNISGWAQTPIQVLMSTDIMHGTIDENGNPYAMPLRDVTNAATATLIYNVHQAFDV